MQTTTEKIWEDFHTKLNSFILKRVPDDQTAEDILQDVFLKIHTRIDTLRNADKLQSWIYQIARNVIADYYRMHKPVTEVPEEIPMPEPLLEDDVIQELAPCIRAMVDSLPADSRQALILTEYEGLSQKDLAERLDISFSGAKSRVQRAREKLKTMLLDCCHFEFDHAGRVIDYQPRCTCCSACN